jgi:Cu/Ag efflux pump CusA
MMRAIIDSSIRFRLLVVALAASAVAVGVTQLPKTSVEVLPDFTPPTVEVQTEALGLSAEEVEELITVPLEQDLLNGVAFLDDIRSESVPGLSRILMIFDEGTDLYTARQVVAERLTQAHALPNVSKPPQMLKRAGRSGRASSASQVSPTSPSGACKTASFRFRSIPRSSAGTTSRCSRSSRRRATRSGSRR